MRQRPIEQVLDQTLAELVNEGWRDNEPWARHFYAGGYGFVGPQKSRLHFLRDNYPVVANYSAWLSFGLFVLRRRGLHTLFVALIAITESAQAIGRWLLNLWHRILFGAADYRLADAQKTEEE